MVIKYPCGLCDKPVAKNHKAIVCDLCNKWVHCKCNNVPLTEYYNLIDDANDESIDANDKQSWICIKCINDNLSFGNLDDKHFYLNSKGITSESELSNISFTLNPSDKKVTSN